MFVDGTDTADGVDEKGEWIQLVELLRERIDLGEQECWTVLIRLLSSFCGTQRFPPLAIAVAVSE
jgi:hypothetical protein